MLSPQPIGRVFVRPDDARRALNRLPSHPKSSAMSADAPVPPAESKRVKKFRLGIAQSIPRFPNDKASLQALQAKSLGSLLIDYANWAIRYVVPRPRQIVIDPVASGDTRWPSLAPQIEALLGKVRAGEDLTAYLSSVPHTRGWTPAASRSGPDVDRWADKDMLLNVMGYHHFHVSPGSYEMLFAAVTRDRFEVVAILDHSVFDSKRQPGKPMAAERRRLWEIYEERSLRGVPFGSVVVSPPIALSGHSVSFTFLAMDYARVVNELDPQLDDPGYVIGIYKKHGWPLPTRPKLEWRLIGLDLGLGDNHVRAFLLLRKGPN